jgi:hypothetical protein
LFLFESNTIPTPSSKSTGLSSFVKTFSKGLNIFLDQAVLLYLNADCAEIYDAFPP